MEELERTKVGRFLKEDAVTLDEVRQKMEQGEGAELFTPLDQIFAELPAVTVTDAKAWMSYNGNDLPERILSAFISIVHRRSCSILRKCFWILKQRKLRNKGRIRQTCNI